MKKIITVREYDNEGRLIKETITEETDDNAGVVYPYYPSYPIIYPSTPYYTTVTV